MWYRLDEVDCCRRGDGDVGGVAGRSTREVSMYLAFKSIDSTKYCTDRLPYDIGDYREREHVRRVFGVGVRNSMAVRARSCNPFIGAMYSRCDPRYIGLDSAA